MTIDESSAEPVDVVQVLKDNKVDVLVSYLPVGSEEADKFYAQCAIDAGVGFVNALPVFIASDPEWAKKFEDAGVPIVGDDIKSQVGATITHRVMAKLFEDRGVALDRTYQLNVGGNMDFKNMLERERLESKKVSKTQAVTSNLKGELADKISDRNVHIGPSDYVAWLDDRKWAYVRLEGRAFGDVPLNLEYKLEVWDSPNSAGIIIDAVRAAKIAMDRGVGGPIIPASTYLMKSPPVQMPDDLGRASSRSSSPASDLAPAPQHRTTPTAPAARRGCRHFRGTSSGSLVQTGRTGCIRDRPDAALTGCTRRTGEASAVRHPGGMQHAGAPEPRRDPRGGGDGPRCAPPRWPRRRRRGVSGVRGPGSGTGATGAPDPQGPRTPAGGGRDPGRVQGDGTDAPPSGRAIAPPHGGTPGPGGPAPCRCGHRG